jgi:hypothetical protein
MFTKKITCVEECSTTDWRLQSQGYDTQFDAKVAAAKVYVVKAAILVKPFEGKWAVFYV